MNAVTETTKHNSIFDTKEQYLAFRAKWKQLHAEGYHTRYRYEYNHRGSYQYNGVNAYGNPRLEYVDGAPGFRMVSKLSVWHHLVFNLAIGRNSPTKAFRLPETPSGYLKPTVWHALNFTLGATHDFDIFGDTLTPEQKAKLLQMVKDFQSKL